MHNAGWKNWSCFIGSASHHPLNPKLIYQYQMLNNNTGKHANMGEEQGGKTRQGEEQKVESKWAQIVSQVMEKVVSGTNIKCCN